MTRKSGNVARFLAIAFFASLALLINAAPCQYDTDKLLGSTCFEFLELPVDTFLADDDTVTLYDQAELYCQGRQKHLAIVKSPGEQFFLASALRTMEWSDALVGLHYRTTPWTWAADGTYLRGQGCLRNSIDSVTMGDLPSVSLDTMTQEKCAEFCSKKGKLFSAVQGGNYCYCTSDYLWSDMAANCSMSCGGRANQQCGSPFNSVVRFLAEDSYDNWLGGRPTIGGHCASIRVDGVTNPWVETSCNMALPFFCKFVDTNAQPYGADRSACSATACYYYYSTPELSWQAADQFCIKVGGRLATVESEARRSIINGILSDPSVTASQVWIGASSKDWYFPDDSSITLREGWASSSEPVNQEINSCADLIVAMTDELIYGWRARSCDVPIRADDETARFICSAPAMDLDGEGNTGASSGNTGSRNSGNNAATSKPGANKATDSWLTARPYPARQSVPTTASTEALADAMKKTSAATINKVPTTGTTKPSSSNNNAGSSGSSSGSGKSSSNSPSSSSGTGSGTGSSSSGGSGSTGSNVGKMSGEGASSSGSSSGSNTGSNSGANSGSSSGSNSGANSGSSSGSNSGANSGFSSGSNSGANSGLLSGSSNSNGATTEPSVTDLLLGPNAGRQVDASSGDKSGGRINTKDISNDPRSSSKSYQTASSSAIADDLPWWAILLIIIGALILVTLIVLLVVYLFKRSRDGRKNSGRISPMSDRPIISSKKNWASSRQSSARTTHGRSNQVLLY